MIDEYKELSDCLLNIMNLLQEFDRTKNDYIKPKIRSYQVQAVHLSKIISGKVKIQVEKLIQDMDTYLSKPENKRYLLIVDDAVALQEALVEL